MLRRGYTLIEMIVALTIGTVIVGISVGMLHMLMRAERAGCDRAPQARILVRLAQQFREDVHAAVQQTAGDQQAEWRFAQAEDRVVTYRALPEEVRRDEHVAGKLVRQESYILPSGCSAAINVQSETPRVVPNLVLIGSVAPLAANREMQVAAALGKDHRFTKLPNGGQ